MKKIKKSKNTENSENTNNNSINYSKSETNNSTLHCYEYDTDDSNIFNLNEEDKYKIKHKIINQEEEDKVDSLSYMYGDRFAKYIKPMVKRYHKTFDELYESIPYAQIIRKDGDMFYHIAEKELFGARGVPYTIMMSRSMILFGEIDSYKDRELIYSSSLKGEIKCPITTEEFLQSIEQKRKEKTYRKD